MASPWAGMEEWGEFNETNVCLPFFFFRPGLLNEFPRFLSFYRREIAILYHHYRLHDFCIQAVQDYSPDLHRSE